MLLEVQAKKANKCPIQWLVWIIGLLQSERSCITGMKSYLVSILHLPERKFSIHLCLLPVLLISLILAHPQQSQSTETQLSQKCVSVLLCGSHHFDSITLRCIDKKYQQELASNSVTYDRTAICCIVCTKQPCFIAVLFLLWSRTSFINKTTKFLFSHLSLWSERKLALDMSKISSIMAAKLLKYIQCAENIR